MEDVLPEVAPVKKTLAGNFRITHPGFEELIFPSRDAVAQAWGEFLRTKRLPVGE